MLFVSPSVMPSLKCLFTSSIFLIFFFCLSIDIWVIQGGKFSFCRQKLMKRRPICFLERTSSVFWKREHNNDDGDYYSLDWREGLMKSKTISICLLVYGSSKGRDLGLNAFWTIRCRAIGMRTSENVIWNKSTLVKRGLAELTHQNEAPRFSMN